MTSRTGRSNSSPGNSHRSCRLAIPWTSRNRAPPLPPRTYPHGSTVVQFLFGVRFCVFCLLCVLCVLFGVCFLVGSRFVFYFMFFFRRKRGPGRARHQGVTKKHGPRTEQDSLRQMGGFSEWWTLLLKGSKINETFNMLGYSYFENPPYESYQLWHRRN